MSSKKLLVAISVTEGRTIRDLFCNGLLDFFREAGFVIKVFTEAVNVPGFVQAWSSPDVTFEPLYPCDSTQRRTRAYFIRRRFIRLKSARLLSAWLRFEEKMVYPPRREYLDVFKKEKPALVLTTHAHLYAEEELISSAHHLNIPTLGIVRSWDNIHKGLKSRPAHLAVWNEVNFEEVRELEGYSADNVTIIGAPQFDPYFQDGNIWSREQLASHFSLDSERPIILFATLGNFFPSFDETCWMDSLVQLIERGSIPGNAQIICRLHPWSRLEHFQKYAKHPFVRLSYVDRYWPALTWHMTREDVNVVGNMLRHADVVITPGSTITLEAAIFNRPTIVPVFHPYQPERADWYFSTWVIGKHFGRIKELNLVPIVESEQDFVDAIHRCLKEPSWYQAQRAQLVREYVHFTDGCSTERLFQTAMKLVRNHAN